MYRGNRESVKVLAIEQRAYDNGIEPFELPSTDSSHDQTYEQEPVPSEWQAMDHKAYENDFESVRSSEAMQQDKYAGDIGANQTPAMNVQMYDRQRQSLEGPPRDIRYSAKAHLDEGSVDEIGPKASLFRRLVHGWTYQVYPGESELRISCWISNTRLDVDAHFPVDSLFFARSRLMLFQLDLALAQSVSWIFTVIPRLPDQS